MARVIVMLLLPDLLGGCGEAARATTYDPRRACEAFSGRYWESDGTCHGGLP
jgi:hypothetical protein